MTQLRNLHRRIKRDVNRLIETGGLNAVTVADQKLAVLWDQLTLPEGYDANSPRSAAQVATTPQRAWIGGIIHYVQPSTTGLRQHAEVASGDVMLDLSAYTVIEAEGRANVKFEVYGEIYAQKLTGSTLQRWFDTRINGQDVFRTLLLQKSS